MPSKSLLLLATFFLVLLIPFTVALGQVEQPPPPPPNPSEMHQQRPATENDARTRMEKDMAKQASKERFEQMKRDAQNLLKLTTELKEYVDKANENTLSLDVIKKAEQIERLARSVKEKMRGE